MVIKVLFILSGSEKMVRYATEPDNPTKCKYHFANIVKSCKSPVITIYDCN